MDDNAKKISVKICFGTTCFVMDGGNLQELKDIIPKKYGNRVELTASNCLELCSINGEYSKAPYVKVDDEIIEEANIEKVLKTINEKLGI